MKPQSLPKYTEVHLALSKTMLNLHPSQVHGLICGILCNSAKHTTAWEGLISGGKTPTKTHEVLQNLYHNSEKQLSDFLFEFQLMLPADSETLPNRAEALSVWCQGFLTGLKLVQIPIVDREPSEMTEAIHDLIEIAKMNHEEVIENEEDEEAYVELVEYIRMAVILIYQESRGEETQAPSSLSHHVH